MSDDKLKQRGHAEENQFFHKQDQELLHRLRQRAKPGDLTFALAEKLAIDDPDLLKRIMDQGITQETGPAFLMAPLVQVAWAEGKVTHKEKRAVLAIAEQNGIAKTSPSHELLEQWLETRPPLSLFSTSLEAIRVGLSVLSADERAQRIEGIMALCRQVAATSGGLARELGLSSGIDQEEKATLDAITKLLTKV